METLEPKKEPENNIEYAFDFKELIRNNPGILRDFKILEKEALEALKLRGVWEHPFKKDKLNIKLLDSLGSYMRVEMDDQTFFVKRVRGYYDDDVDSGGADEFLSAQQAATALEGIEGVKVVDFQFGYQNDDVSYFVSKWVDGTPIGYYLEEIKNKDKTAYIDLRTRALEIEGHLYQQGFVDGWKRNMIYNPKEDTIYVFDVH